MAGEKIGERSPWWAALAGTGLLGAVLGAAVTGGFNYLSHQNDLDAKMIELSVGILRAEPTAETRPLREWAIDVIDKRAKFKFDAVQRKVLLNKQLPFQPYIYLGTPTGGFLGKMPGTAGSSPSSDVPTTSAPSPR